MHQGRIRHHIVKLSKRRPLREAHAAIKKAGARLPMRPRDVVGRVKRRIGEAKHNVRRLRH